MVRWRYLDPLIKILIGIVVAHIVDYFTWSLIISSLIAGGLLGILARGFREAVSLTLVSLNAWLIAMYIYASMDPYRLAMLEIFSAISGLSTPTLLSLTIITFSLTGSISSALLYTIRRVMEITIIR